MFPTIVVFTKHASAANARTAYALGADAIISKSEAEEGGTTTDRLHDVCLNAKRRHEIQRVRQHFLSWPSERRWQQICSHLADWFERENAGWDPKFFHKVSVCLFDNAGQLKVLAESGHQSDVIRKERLLTFLNQRIEEFRNDRFGSFVVENRIDDTPSGFDIIAQPIMPNIFMDSLNRNLAGFLVVEPLRDFKFSHYDKQFSLLAADILADFYLFENLQNFKGAVSASGKSVGETFREVEAMMASGKSVGEILRSLGVSEAALSLWLAHHGGQQGEEVKGLKQLEDENSRLKRLVAEQALEIQILKEVAREN
jgi:hypothetical protein